MSDLAAKKTSSILLYYQCLLALTAVAILFTEADNYLYDSGMGPSASMTVVLFAIAAIPLIPNFINHNIKYIPFSLFKFYAVFLFVSFISYQFVIKNPSITSDFNERILATISMIVLLLILSGEKIIQQTVRWGLFLATFWNIYSYIRELIVPEAWVTLTTSNPTGRPAGLYVDPNQAGCALIFGMIFSIYLISKNFRLGFFLIVFISVLTTFSRGAILCMLILLPLGFVKKTFATTQIKYVLVIFILLMMTWGGIGEFLIDEATNYGIINSDIETRINTFTNPKSRESSDDTSRVDIIGFSLERFMESPIFGHGIGYTQVWTGIIRPHNTYLLYMVEHGFLGFFALPCLIFLLIKDARDPEIKNMGLYFAILTSIWGLFSHTLLEERGTLLTFALMAIMSKRSNLSKSLPSQKR
jgi:O-Antigen ligase